MKPDVGQRNEFKEVEPEFCEYFFAYEKEGVHLKRDPYNHSRIACFEILSNCNRLQNILMGV